MNTQKEFEDTLGEVCLIAFTLIGRTQAYEVYIQSLVSTLVEKFPDLRESFKEQFADVSDLQRAAIRSKVTLDSYNETVNKLMDNFKLMKGGGFFEE